MTEKITGGAEWKAQIDAHMESARVILLLVSPDFLASDYCYDIEMKHALERHKNGSARVVPIILRPVDWHDAPFGKLQALPKDGKAISTWPNKDLAYRNVVEGLRLIIRELRSVASSTQSRESTTAVDPRASGRTSGSTADDLNRDTLDRLAQATEALSRGNPGGVAKQIGERIRARRHELNITQFQLASQIGREPAWLSRVERGGRLTAESLLAIAQALNGSNGYFLGQEDRDSIIRGASFANMELRTGAPGDCWDYRGSSSST